LTLLFRDTPAGNTSSSSAIAYNDFLKFVKNYG